MTSKKQAAFLEMVAKSKKPVKKAFGGVEDVKKMKDGGEVDRKSTNTKNVNNSKSRQVERDRARFKGQSASTPKAKPDYSDRTLRSSADSSGQPKSYSSESASKPNKIPGVGSRVLNAVGKAAGPVLRGAGTVLGKVAGPASLMFEPSELGDSDTKESKTSYSPTSARDRADELAGQPKPSSNSKPAEAVVAVKKSDSKSMAAPVKKPSPRETSGSRASRQAAYDAFKADQVDYNKGLANDRMGVSADETAAEDMITEGKLDGMKKGGMTKRPPARPAKKVPARKFASGGTTRSSTSHRGDGCATKGHTKGRVR